MIASPSEIQYISWFWEFRHYGRCL